MTGKTQMPFPDVASRRVRVAAGVVFTSLIAACAPRSYVLVDEPAPRVEPSVAPSAGPPSCTEFLLRENGARYKLRNVCNVEMKVRYATCETGKEHECRSRLLGGGKSGDFLEPTAVVASGESVEIPVHHPAGQSTLKAECPPLARIKVNDKGGATCSISPQSVTRRINEAGIGYSITNALDAASLSLYKQALMEADNYKARQFTRSERFNQAGWALLSRPQSNPAHWRKAKIIFDENAAAFSQTQQSRLAMRAEDKRSEGLGRWLVAEVQDVISKFFTGERARRGVTAAWGREFTSWAAENHQKHHVRFTVLPLSGEVGGRKPFVNAIGRLYSSVGACTAFLTAPNVAVTNAHCVGIKEENEQGKILSYTPIPPDKFQLIFDRLEVIRRVGVESIFINPGYATRPGCGADWAILKLQHPVGGPDVVYLETAPGAAPEDVATAGYPADISEGAVMTAHWGCPAARFFDGPHLYGPLLYRCHGFFGASGSPVVDVTPGSRSWGKVVAVNACSDFDKANFGIGTHAEKFHRVLQAYIRAVHP